MDQKQDMIALDRGPLCLQKKKNIYKINNRIVGINLRRTQTSHFVSGVQGYEFPSLGSPNLEAPEVARTPESFAGQY